MTPWVKEGLMQILAILLATVAYIFAGTGLIGFFLAGIYFLVTAFRHSVAWGLGCLFVPLVSIVFLVMYWEETKRPFFVQLGCLASMMIGGWLFGLLRP